MIHILETSIHRNGVGGAPFLAIRFLDSEEKEKSPFIASYFGHSLCAVYSISELHMGNIAFAQGNSWRGDRYESYFLQIPEISKILKEYFE